MKQHIPKETEGSNAPSRLTRVRLFLKRANGISLSPFDPLMDAARFLSSSVRKHFPVIHDGRLVGILSRNSLATALRERGEWVPVADIMTKRHPRLRTEEFRHPPFFVYSQSRPGQCIMLS